VGPGWADRPGPAARKLFLSRQAPQAIEKVDSERENPRKSKSKERASEVSFAASSRLADNIQTPNLLGFGGREFFASLTVQPIENKRSTTLHGGKRRKTAAA
jgi:hypothetical protein